MIFVIEVFGFGVGDSIVEDKFSSFAYLLDSLSNLSIQVVGDWQVADLRDSISGNTPTLHGHYPVINRQFAFILRKQLL